MNVLEWAKRYPDDVDRVVAIATAGRLARSVSRSTRSPGGRSARTRTGTGQQLRRGPPSPDEGLALARQIGHIMYLSKASMERKFGRRSAAATR